MLNIQKSKNTVLISNISIITFLNLALYTRAASLLALRGLEARGRTSRGQDPRGRGQDPRGQGQVFWPRGRGQASRLNISADGGICHRCTRTTFRSQPNSAIYVFESVVNSPVGSGAKPQIKSILVHFKRMYFFGVSWIAFKKHVIWSKYKPKLGALVRIWWRGSTVWYP